MNTKASQGLRGGLAIDNESPVKVERSIAAAFNRLDAAAVILGNLVANMEARLDGVTLHQTDASGPADEGRAQLFPAMTESVTQLAERIEAVNERLVSQLQRLEL